MSNARIFARLSILNLRVATRNTGFHGFGCLSDEEDGDLRFFNDCCRRDVDENCWLHH